MSPKVDVADERRAHIMQAALACFTRKGYNNNTMDDIVAESGLSKGTLYWYFKSKDDLFAAAITSSIMDWGEEALSALGQCPTASDKLRTLAQWMVDLCKTFEGFFGLFLEFWASSLRREEASQLWVDMLVQYKDAIVEIIEEGIRNGELQPVDAEQLVWALMAAYDGLAAYIMFIPDNVKVAFLDQDQSSLSRRYLAQLESAEDVDLSYQTSNYHQIERWFIADRIKAAVIIPQGFKDDLEQGRTVGLQVLIDGTDPNTANHAIRHIVLPTENFAARWIADRLDQAGTPVEHLSPIDLRLSTWYNPSMRFAVGTIPALVAVVMSMPAVAATLTITREKERGTLEGLIATPISRSELLVGKLVPYIFTGLLSAVLCVAEAVFIFDVPFQGNLLLYLLLTADFLLASLSLALALSAVINNQQAAMLASMLIFIFPGFFLSGLLLPLASMGPEVKMESLMLPTTHFVMISRGMFTKGLGLGTLWGHAVALLSMGVLFLMLSTLLFKKKLT